MVHRSGKTHQFTGRLIDAFLNAFGNAQLTVACQQINRSHFAHIHTHRIGGSAQFGTHRGKCRRHFSGFFIIVRNHGCNGDKPKIRCLLVYLYAHTADQTDDIFHLVRIIKISRQVVIHFRISEEALHFAFGDKFFELRLLIFLIHFDIGLT